MKAFPKFIATVAACALLGTPVLAQQGGGPGNGNGNGGGGNGAGGGNTLMTYLVSLPSETVDAQEQADLIHMRQEEKLARDVYLTLYSTTGATIFQNIAQSEQSHMDLTLYLMNKYGIADPLTSNAVGVFPDPAFTHLYERLVNIGGNSLFRSLWVGAVIEDLDIYDLDMALANTDNQDIATVWQNLARGSRNHMRSFYGQLQNFGYTYTGIWLSVTRIVGIVITPPEHQAVDENGVVLP